ncbi:MAG: hypothetical protein ACREJ3_00905, partial [Polyangiaceae bacterium]
MEPIEADSYDSAGTSYPGPGGGPGVSFLTYLPVGPTYELTVQPEPPFSAAFPPDVIQVGAGGTRTRDTIGGFDVTREETDLGHPTIPTFDISRVAGLDGWTAYLRDVATQRVLSNVAKLSASRVPSVVLATNHTGHDPSVDALTNAELVMDPPAGALVPRGVFAPAGVPPAQELPSQETYPPLPPAVAVRGRIATSSGAPVLADVTFQAFAIVAGGRENTANFEFLTRAAASLDPRTGAAVYSVDVPPGQYNLVVQPVDAASGVTQMELDVPAQAGPLMAPAITVAAAWPVHGRATVADGRPLSEGLVDAVPVRCAASTSHVAGSAADPVTTCLPRAQETTTGADGSFSLSLGPGDYLLRIRPADGTRLPWVVEPLSVGGAAANVPAVIVPAPIRAGQRLVDPSGNPVVRAVVRVFTVPLSGQAVEIGRAMTDASGRYD